MSVKRDAASGCGQGLALCVIMAAMGFGIYRCNRWISPPIGTVALAADGTDGTSGADGVSGRTQPNAGGWLPASENIRDGVKIYGRTYDGKMYYWVQIASAKATMRDVGDDRPKPCVMVEFPNGTIEWKTVELVGSALHYVHTSDPALAR